MRSALLRPGLRFLALAAWALPLAAGPAAAALPHQMIFPPLALDPLDFDPPSPLAFSLTTGHLPDSRRAESYVLEGWVRVAESHAVRWHLDYAGIESGEFFRHGGGASGLQWTSRLSSRLALDLAGRPPLGDETLHPLSSRAPSVELRIRFSPLRGERWRTWVGWWTRRVSPPTDSEHPDEDFPSGSGLELAAHGTGRSWSWSLHLRRAFAGLPRSTGLDLSGDLPVAGDVALRLGFATQIGPREDRPFDLQWQVGVAWRPGSADSSPDGGDRIAP